jgi:hypothetical protein
MHLKLTYGRLKMQDFSLVLFLPEAPLIRERQGARAGVAFGGKGKKEMGIWRGEGTLTGPLVVKNLATPLPGTTKSSTIFLRRTYAA